MTSRKQGAKVESSALPINQIVCGDCLEVMKSFPSESIDLIVTSPPYFSIDIWQLDDLDSYLKFLQSVWHQLFRTLTIGSRFCLNIRDYYTSKTKNKDKQRKIIPTSWFSLNLAIHAGFTFKDQIFWDKMSSGYQGIYGSYPYPVEVIVENNRVEHIFILQKGARRDWSKIRLQRLKSKFTLAEYHDFNSAIWRIPAERNREHPAPFPEELCKRLIKMFSFIDDVILDPFVGSGTTCVVAKKLGRKWIGIDINPEYVDMAKKRVNAIPERLEKFLEASP